ncbi:MAG: hypothetical protein HYR74_08950 [Candidatus Eisenbacteria bacterium]|nr:hypothetical protein [Candidatus Eisenbacteria bacterium]
MVRGRIVRPLAAAALAAALAFAPAHAAPRLADVGGHIALGYSHLFTDQSPGGSLSTGVGIDVPIAPSLRAGIDVGYHLLGSRTLLQGSLTSGLDYSVFEALAMVHWTRAGRGPALTVSGGPGVFIAHADLASSPIGATFSNEAVGETRLGAAFGVTLARGSASPVRAGIEAGVRIVPITRAPSDASLPRRTETWSIATLRFALLY